MSFILKSTPPGPPSSGRASVAPPTNALGALEGGVLDLSRWPLVNIAFKPRATEEEIARLFKNIEVVLRARQGPFVAVVDARGTREISARHRKIVADHLAQNTDLYRHRCAGHAFVFEGTALRGALTAIFWMTPPPYPYRIFPDVPTAERWALDQLDR
jgi:hypothetical protein